MFLPASEKNYSQFEKEDFAIVFALKHFKRILSGRYFMLNTDHRILLKIFGQQAHITGLPTRSKGRIKSAQIFATLSQSTILATRRTLEFDKRS